MAVVWFGALCLAMVGGSLAIAMLFGLVGALAAMQVASKWRGKRGRANALVAGVGAGLLPLAAWLSNRATAIVLLAWVLAALLLDDGLKLAPDAFSAKALSARLPNVSATLRSGIFIGLGSAAVVQVDRVDGLSIIFLAAIVSVYETGDFLIGAGQRNRWVGVAAGLVGVAVVTVTMSAVYPQDLRSDAAVRGIGLLVGLACPLGQIAGSWMLPTTRTKAPAVRRIDSWIVAAPAFLVASWLFS